MVAVKWETLFEEGLVFVRSGPFYCLGRSQAAAIRNGEFLSLL